MDKFPLHIPFRQLTDYAEGRLSITDRVQVGAHLAVCAACAAKVARLERLLGSTPAEINVDPPLPLIARIKKLFRSRTTSPSMQPERSRLVAALHFDSRARTGSLGVRAGKPGTRQLLFRTAEHEIDLRIEPSKSAWAIAGQILGGSAHRGQAILQSSVFTVQVDLNELSEFTLASIEEGTYKLTLSLENIAIEIDELKIGR